MFECSSSSGACLSLTLVPISSGWQHSPRTPSSSSLAPSVSDFRHTSTLRSHLRTRSERIPQTVSDSLIPLFLSSRCVVCFRYRTSTLSDGDWRVHRHYSLARLLHIVDMSLDNSYQAGQAKAIRRPDVKKKLVVVGDGTYLPWRQLVLGPHTCFRLRFDRWLRKDVSSDRVR